jgi:DNA-binding NarL/FixJ family response regulator
MGSSTGCACDGFRDPLIRAGLDVTQVISTGCAVRPVLTDAHAGLVVLDGSIVSKMEHPEAFAHYKQVALLLAIDSLDLIDAADQIRLGFRASADVTATRRTLGPAALAVAAGRLCVAPLFIAGLVGHPVHRRHLRRLPDNPTARQCDVWNLVVRNMLNGAIATGLGIAASTARFHVSSIWVEPGLKSRKELLARLSPSEVPVGRSDTDVSELHC